MRAREAACGATRQVLPKPQGTRQFDALLCNNLQHAFNAVQRQISFLLYWRGCRWRLQRRNIHFRDHRNDKPKGAKKTSLKPTFVTKDDLFQHSIYT